MNQVSAATKAIAPVRSPAKAAAPEGPFSDPAVSGTLIGGFAGFVPGLMLGVTLADRIPFKSYGGALGVYLASIGAGLVIGGLVGHAVAAKH
ncbi:MAG: hypothetical protein JWN41_276 [Thermoleophilia bacterium]|nr:hypothetical protein [Thermoleophilia bacterium]